MLKWNGAALKRARKTRGWTQIQLAIRLADVGATKKIMQPNRVHGWETNVSAPRAEIVANLAFVLGVTMESFFIEPEVRENACAA